MSPRHVMVGFPLFPVHPQHTVQLLAVHDQPITLSHVLIKMPPMFEVRGLSICDRQQVALSEPIAPDYPSELVRFRVLDAGVIAAARASIRLTLHNPSDQLLTPYAVLVGTVP